MTKELLDPILGTGIVGVIAIVLAWVVVHLWREGKDERKEHKDEIRERDRLLAESNDSRISDAQKTSDVLVEIHRARAKEISVQEQILDRLNDEDRAFRRASQVDPEELESPAPSSPRLGRPTPAKDFRPPRPPRAR